jgi:hypothetical protein
MVQPQKYRPPALFAAGGADGGNLLFIIVFKFISR